MSRHAFNNDVYMFWEITSWNYHPAWCPLWHDLQTAPTLGTWRKVHNRKFHTSRLVLPIIANQLEWKRWERVTWKSGFAIKLLSNEASMRKLNISPRPASYWYLTASICVSTRRRFCFSKALKFTYLCDACSKTSCKSTMPAHPAARWQRLCRKWHPQCCHRCSTP